MMRREGQRRSARLNPPGQTPPDAAEMAREKEPRLANRQGVKSASTIFWFLLALAGAGSLRAANDSATSVAELSWLAGQWRGTTPAGRTIETTYTTAEGGVLLGTSKEYTADGRCVFFDLEHFAMKDGVLTLTPHPGGKRSRNFFPLESLDRAARRAAFVNRAHDWPQQFVYERLSEERLRITLSGPDKKGANHIERIELRRVR